MRVINENQEALYQQMVNKYLQTNNLMDKAEILKDIKDQFDVYVYALSIDVFECERNVYRQLGLNKLIPEFKEMVRAGNLPKLKAYSLSALPEITQRKLYNQHQMEMMKNNHDYLMKVVAKVASEAKKQKKK